MKEKAKRVFDYLYVAEVVTIFATLVVSLVAYASYMRGF